MSSPNLHEKASITRVLLLVAMALGPVAACTTEPEQDARKNQEVYERIDEVGDGRLNLADY